MKLKRKIALILLPILILAALVYAFLPKPVLVETAPITRGPLVQVVRDDGRTRIKDRYLVSSPVAGQLQRITLKPGHSVEAGAPLATIIPAPPELLDPRARAAAEARVQAAEEARRQAEALIQRAQAAQEYAQSELNRITLLQESGSSTTQELEHARLNLRIAASELDSAQFQVRITEHQLQLAQTAFLWSQPEPAGASPESLVQLRSPVSGKVLRLLQESTAIVIPGAPLLELGDPRNLEIEIDVLSSDAVKIQPGAKVLLEYWGGPEPLEARVRLVEPAGFLKISALGVEEQRVWVIADFTSPPEAWQNLGDAYRVEARIVVWESPDVLKVPVGALFRVEEDWAVFKVVADRAELQPVQIGHRGEHEAELLEGLAPGDHVILHPSDRVHDGVSVQPRPL